MFSVKEIEGSIPTVELADGATASVARLAPDRGGMLTALSIGGRELFYLDRTTFEDRTANVRGGNPVLFPSPGRLAADTWSRGGARGSMKQHGFARTLPWSLEDRGFSADVGAWARLALTSNEGTRAQYPWDFRAAYTYTLKGRVLRIDLQVTNESSTEMPFGVGFHPYFVVSHLEKSRVKIKTLATRAFDNTEKREIAFTGFDLTQPEVDLHLIDHGLTESSLEIGEDPHKRISLRASPEFTHWVVWTLKGKDFVCLEPWTCPGNALNTGERLILLPPGQMKSLWIEIAGG